MKANFYVKVPNLIASPKDNSEMPVELSIEKCHQGRVDVMFNNDKNCVYNFDLTELHETVIFLMRRAGATIVQPQK